MSLEYRTLNLSDPDTDIQQVHEICSQDLSEPYTVAIYDYFMKNWPELSIFAIKDGRIIALIVGALTTHNQCKQRGYIAMLAVKKEFRNQGIAKTLVQKQIDTFKSMNADEVVLETEYNNNASIQLYQNMGFVKTKRMFRFYFGMTDAFRLALPLTERALKPSIFLTPVEEIATRY